MYMILPSIYCQWLLLVTGYDAGDVFVKAITEIGCDDILSAFNSKNYLNGYL